MSDRLQCPHCNRSFDDANARWMHAKAKHRREKTAHLRPVTEDDDNESLADAMIHAQQNPDDADYEWAREMLP